jgi:type IV pilus assembly protein PilP
MTSLSRLWVVVLGAALLGACTGGMDDLDQYVKEVKARPGGRIEPLPEIKPYESFVYDAGTLRSPFVPDVPVAAEAGGGGNGVRPDTNRNREFLEQFPLDTLRMVGTLEAGGAFFGLVQDKDGLVHRVLPGNHLGQNDGKILRITPSTIELTEIVPDGLGGYFERPAAVALDSK